MSRSAVLTNARRRTLLQAGAGALAGAVLPASAVLAGEGGDEKVLRVAFRAAETSFDPSQINDIYSRTITGHIFEGLYTYDPLARPVKHVPLTAAALPQVSDNWRVWTVQLRPGIYFADDPAFGGRRRELVAQDYVYTFRRFADPRLKSPVWGGVESMGILGLAQSRQRAIDHKQPYDYDTPIEGLRALDRYTLQFRLQESRPRFIENLVGGDLFGAVAREVVEHYGEQFTEHPVGTGPFVLAQWRRASHIVLRRNPQYRELTFDASPSPDDAQGQAILARLKGRRLPMVDRVEVAIIEENQPRWLAFLNNELDVLNEVPPEFIGQALPNGRVAPHLAKQGIDFERIVRSDFYTTFFNMEDAVVGGYTPDRVALRRAIGLAIDARRELALVLGGQGIVAQSFVVPNTTAYDPAYKSEMSRHDPARAKALLDLYGYVDRDGDGWREQPDGQPLVLEWSIEDNLRGRQLAEQYERTMRGIGLKIRFKIGKWPELLRAARAGQFSIWHVGSVASSPDSQGSLQRLDGRQAGGQNIARFHRPEFDALYDRISAMPDGPERVALIREANRIALAWMPYKIRLHTFVTDLVRPQVVGYRRPLFSLDWWQYVDVQPPKARA